MQKKILNGVIAILVLAVVILGMLLYQTRKQVNQLAGWANLFVKGGTISAVDSQTTINQQIEAEKRKTKFVARINGITDKKMNVGTRLMDFSKPVNPEKKDNKISDFTSMYEMMLKPLTLVVGENTVFENTGLNELANGDSIKVTTVQSPYSGDELNVLELEKVELSAKP